MIESRFSMKLTTVMLMTGLWFASGASAQEPAATPRNVGFRIGGGLSRCGCRQGGGLYRLSWTERQQREP